MISSKVILSRLSSIYQLMESHGDKYTMDNYKSMMKSLITDLRSNLPIPNAVESSVNNILTSPVDSYTEFNITSDDEGSRYYIYNGSTLIESIDIKLLTKFQMTKYNLLHSNVLPSIFYDLRHKLSWTLINLPGILELETQLRELYNLNDTNFGYQFKGADYLVLSPDFNETIRFNGMYLHNLLKIYNGLGLSYKTYLSNDSKSYKLLIESDDKSICSILASKA